MIFPKAKKIAREQGWYKTKDTVFGLYKDYFFNIGDGDLTSNPQFKYVIASTDQLSEETKQLLREDLESNKKALEFSSVEIEDTSIVIHFIESFTSTKIKTVYALLDFLVELFQKHQLAPQYKCHNCDTVEKPKYYNINEMGILLCDSCFRKIETEFYEVEREKIMEEKNYLTGFLGAVLFSIPAIVGWVLIAVYLERLASAIAVVIAILGIKGYEYFNGKNGPITKYIIVFANALSIVIANFATICFLLLNEGLTLIEAFLEFQQNSLVQDVFYDDLLLSFALAFFVWIWLLVSLKDKKMSVKLAEKVS